MFKHYVLKCVLIVQGYFRFGIVFSHLAAISADVIYQGVDEKILGNFSQHKSEEGQSLVWLCRNEHIWFSLLFLTFVWWQGAIPTESMRKGSASEDNQFFLGIYRLISEKLKLSRSEVQLWSQLISSLQFPSETIYRFIRCWSLKMICLISWR